MSTETHYNYFAFAVSLLVSLIVMLCMEKFLPDPMPITRRQDTRRRSQLCRHLPRGVKNIN